MTVVLLNPWLSYRSFDRIALTGNRQSHVWQEIHHN